VTPGPPRWRFALVGSPVAHSRSPDLFAALAAGAGTTCDYTLADISGPALDAWWSGPARELHGFNVTVPHKTTAAARCTALSGPAARIGAVNAVRLEPDRGTTGTNTDAAGFDLTLGDAAFERAVVLGAGGAARAVVDVLLGRGVARVRLVNRSPARAAELVASRSASERARVSTTPWSHLADALDGADLVVQTTSAALSAPEALATLPWESTTASALAVDLVYRPRRTAFLLGAARGGRRTADGLTMLAGQAAAAFDFFRGVESDPQVFSGVARGLADSLRAGVD
jgi:shikimate dehydrogenase